MQFGLVDASSDSDLDEKLDQLEKKWDDLEIPFNFPPEFHSWFKAYSREVIVKSMLRPVREKAGLGCPPSPYYTNDIESKNNILKQHLCRKPSALTDFVDSMKAMITIQRTEVEKAVASHGEYRMASQYSSLSCDQQKWFKMSSKQRQGKIASFMKASVTPSIKINTSSGIMQEQSSPLESLMLPTNMAKTIWSRARSIVEEAAIINAPGEDTAYIVRSNSGQNPSLKGTGIESLVEWYKNLKYKPNYTALAESGKPSSAGKKKLKGVTQKISRITDEADEEDFTSRIPPAEKVEATSANDDFAILLPPSQSTTQTYVSASQNSVVGDNRSVQQSQNVSVSSLGQQLVTPNPNATPIQSPQMQHHFSYMSGVHLLLLFPVYHLASLLQYLLLMLMQQLYSHNNYHL